MLKKFRNSERGFALVLTLLFLPVFIGVGLLVVDIGRGNNAQADHQAAADALALAGARELDGQSGARIRAREAMEQLANDVSFLGLSGDDVRITLSYDMDTPGPFTVIFLSALPGDEGVDGDDDTLLTQEFVDEYVATSDETAKYVYVFSQSRDLTTFFFNPATRSNEDVPVAAMAVATMQEVTCDLAPFYICNPFDDAEELNSKFEDGELYGKLLKLSVHTGAKDAGRGNIGFLRINDPGAGAVAAALAGTPYDECVKLEDSVDTQPGTVSSAWVGYNTRFDMYGTGFGNAFRNNGAYFPSQNSRKGYQMTGTNACNVRSPREVMGEPPTQAGLDAYFLKAPFMSDNVAVDQPDDPATEQDESYLGRGSWNFLQSQTVKGLTYPSYWDSAYSTALDMETIIGMSRHPNKSQITESSSLTDIKNLEDSTGIPFVSRYDVYRYENSLIASGKLSQNAEFKSGTTERNLPACYSGSGDWQNPKFDRRTMLVAVIDCDEEDIRGATTNVPVSVFAKMFLVRPVDGQSSRVTMDMEIVDVTTNAGVGDTDEFLKAEAFLVR